MLTAQAPAIASETAPQLAAKDNLLPAIYLARNGEMAWTLTGQHTGVTRRRNTRRNWFESRSRYQPDQAPERTDNPLLERAFPALSRCTLARLESGIGEVFLIEYFQPEHVNL